MKRSLRTLALGASALVATGLLVACEPPPPGRTYTVDIDATTGAAAPAATAGDDDVYLDITLENTSVEGSVIRSVNLIVPPVYTVVDAPDDTVPGGPAVQIRDLDIVPGDSQTFTIQVAVTSCVPASPPNFAVDPMVTSDYTGDGNRFGRDLGSDTNVAVVGTCGLAFAGGPAAAEVGTPITSVPADPTGLPIAVELIDAGGTDRATAASAPISLSAARGGGAVALGGTTTSTTSLGVADFSPGPIIAETASDFTLTATSSALPGVSVTSGTFPVVSDGADCLANEECSATASTSQGGQTVSASFGPGGSDVKLLLSIEPLDAPAFECDGYPATDQSFVSQFDFVGDASDRLGTMTVTFPAPKGGEDDEDEDEEEEDDGTKATVANGGRYEEEDEEEEEEEEEDDEDEDGPNLTSYRVCWAAPYEFTTRDGSPAGIQGTKPSTGEPLHVGLLPDCDLGDGATADPPCVESITYDPTAKTISIVVSTDGRDPWRY